MTTAEDYSKPYGLPGLRAIRDRLGVTAQDVALRVGVTTNWLSIIERGHDDCTDKLKRQLANFLRCTVVDLITQPSDQRLAEIEAAYLQARADEARARAQGGAA